MARLQPGLDGRLPEPGAWNRFQLEVDNRDAKVAALRDAGAALRKDVVEGTGGRQALVEDPAGNCVDSSSPPATPAIRTARGHPPAYGRPVSLGACAARPTRRRPPSSCWRACWTTSLAPARGFGRPTGGRATGPRP